MGLGRLPEPELIVEAAARLVSRQDFSGHRVLVTAGPTHEDCDPVRFLTNRSSGKMGYCLAKVAWRRGAEVCLVSGPSHLPAPYRVELVLVRSARRCWPQSRKDLSRQMCCLWPRRWGIIGR